MDDEAKFGTVFHRLTFGERSNVTCSPTIRSLWSVSTTTLTALAEKGILVTATGRDHRRSYLGGTDRAG